jgi:uncharacterized protein (TIGR02271 family)
MAKTIIGLFNDKIDAERAIRELASAGFPRADIDLIARNGAPTADRDVVENLARVGVPGEEAREYASRLSSGKALVLVKASEAAAQRAVTVMERNAVKQVDQEGVRTAVPPGSTVPPPVGVTPPSVTPPTTGAPGVRKEAHSQEERIPVVEEKMKVGKRQVAEQTVHVDARVVEEPVEREILLRQEHVNVERHPVDRPATEQDLREFKEGTIEMSETAEEPVVSKEAHVVEEVVVSKDTTQENRAVRDTLRKTEVDVEKGASAASRPERIAEADRTAIEASRVAGAEVRTTEGPAPAPRDDNELTLAREDVARARDIEEHRTEERNPTHFTPEANPFRDSSGGNAGVIPEHEYALRYGQTLASDPQHRGKDWEAVEPEVQREWATHKKGAWEEFKEMVRRVWHNR